MKLFNKSTMTAALTAAMFGGVFTVQEVTAIPYADNTSIGVATIAAGGDPYVANDGLGQALIYPYYTVRDGFRTTINVFNASSTRAIAVKVRFREFQNSRDVLDFNLVLSPNDKWFGVVLYDEEKGAKLSTTDNSCTVPAIVGTSGAPFSKASYNDAFFIDSGDQGVNRLRSGYVEIIPMAWSGADGGAGDGGGAIVDADADGVDDYFQGALHAQPAGTPANCATIVDGFRPTSTWSVDMNGVFPAGTMDGNPLIAGDPSWEAIPKGATPLFGEYGIFNKEGGVAGGGNAIALADWMTAGVPLFTAQEFPYYLEPTLATSAGLWDTGALKLTDDALTSSRILNEWSNNDGNGASVDWVVTMPTKSFHSDQEINANGGTVVQLTAGNTLEVLADMPVAGAKFNIQAGSSNYRFDRSTPQATPVSPFSGVFTAGMAQEAINISQTMFNNEEGNVGAGGDVNFSPGTSFSNPRLRYEANVINFGGKQVLKAGNMANDDTVALILDPVGDIPGELMHGYLDMQILGDGTGGVGAAGGLPIVGFAVKQRSMGDSTKAYGQLFDHKWQN